MHIHVLHFLRELACVHPAGPPANIDRCIIAIRPLEIVVWFLVRVLHKQTGLVGQAHYDCYYAANTYANDHTQYIALKNVRASTHAHINTY